MRFSVNGVAGLEIHERPFLYSLSNKEEGREGITISVREEIVDCEARVLV